MTPLAATLADLVRTAERPFEDARAMPPGVYTGEDFLARELEMIFSKEWACIGRSSSLKEPGDYVAYELAGQPIVVLREAP